MLLFIIGISGCSQEITNKQSEPVEVSTSAEAEEMKTDSGRYTGQADSNFIEIQISGVPDEKSWRACMLS